jgi:hypothetical protein
MSAPAALPPIPACLCGEYARPVSALLARDEDDTDEKRIDMVFRVSFGILFAVVAFVCVLLFWHGPAAVAPDNPISEEYGWQI